LLDQSVTTVLPVFTELIREAAKGDIMHNDDTTARVLELMKANKSVDEAEEGERKRTGIFTSGFISKRDDRQIALYFTGREHAGENLAKVLEECEPNRGVLIQMSDGLSRNAATYLPE